MTSPWRRAARLLSAAGLVYQLTSPLWAAVTDEQAQALLVRVRAALTPLGITVDREILIKMRTRDELQIEKVTRGGRNIEVNGFYQAYNPETIWAASDLDETRTLATLAHELTHAWQSTHAPLQDRKLHEGFARWCEYHALLNLGCERLANRLLEDADPDYGDGLRFLMRLEEAQGAAAVIEYASTRSRTEEP